MKQNYVVGFQNITGVSYAGKSGKHDATAPAVVTSNGAGPHNVQLFFLSPDGVVLHCLLGYWAPNDLLVEMRFVQNYQWKLWNSSLSMDEKKKRFRQNNLLAVRTLPSDLVGRSHLQSFDAKHEMKKPQSDFVFRPGDFHPPQPKGMKSGNLKSTVQVIHERMAKRPFVPYDEFDIEAFSDYGRERYDKKEETRVATPAKKR